MIVTAENIMRKIVFFHKRFYIYKDDRHLKRYFFHFFILIIRMDKTSTAKICRLS